MYSGGEYRTIVHFLDIYVSDNFRTLAYLCLRVASTGPACISLTFMSPDGEYQTSKLVRHHEQKSVQNIFRKRGVVPSKVGIFNKLVTRYEGHFQDYIQIISEL